MIPFSERYKTFEDLQLIRITINPEDYQDEAVDAATEEINNRQLSEEKINELTDIILQENQESLINEERKRAKKNIIQKQTRQFIQKLNPFKSNIPWPVRFIRFVVILLGIITIATWTTQAKFLLNQFPLGEFSLSYYGFVLFRILLLLALPVIIVLFFKKKPIGWIFTFSYTLYRSVSLAVLSTFYIRTPGIIDSTSYTIMYISLSLVLLIVSIVLLQQKVRTIFNIKKTTGLLIAVFVFLISFLSTFPYLQS